MHIGIYTEDGLDQVVETTGQLRTERAYLQGAGHTVFSHSAAREDAIHLIHYHMRAGRSFVTARRKAVAQEPVTS